MLSRRFPGLGFVLLFLLQAYAAQLFTLRALWFSHWLVTPYEVNICIAPMAPQELAAQFTGVQAVFARCLATSAVSYF